MYKILFLLAILFIPFGLSAHPGNTDSYGCHTCKTNCPKWGLDYSEYHCHASKGVPQPIEPVRSIKSNTGTGVTVPAPEYKTPKAPSAVPIKTAIPKSEVQQTEKQDIIPIANSITEQPTSIPQPEKKRNVFLRFFSWLF